MQGLILNFFCKILYFKTHFLFIAGCFILCMFLYGCKGTDRVAESPRPGDYVLKSGSISISPDDFGEELELKKSAYSYGIVDRPYEYNELVLDLASQLSEEIVLRRAAAADGIFASEKDITNAEKKIKKDFPGDSFQKMLLENAVSYSLWRKRLGIRLLINRVIAKELKAKVEITPEEIADYYKLQKKSGEFAKGENNGSYNTKMDGEELIARLRRKEAEEEYPAWIKNLTRKFPVQINEKELSGFLKKIPLKKNIQFKRNNKG